MKGMKQMDKSWCYNTHNCVMNRITETDVVIKWVYLFHSVNGWEIFPTAFGILTTYTSSSYQPTIYLCFRVIITILVLCCTIVKGRTYYTLLCVETRNNIECAQLGPHMLGPE